MGLGERSQLLQTEAVLLDVDCTTDVHEYEKQQHQQQTLLTAGTSHVADTAAGRGVVWCGRFDVVNRYRPSQEMPAGGTVRRQRSVRPSESPSRTDESGRPVQPLPLRICILR